jgi:hypothetical protein
MTMTMTTWVKTVVAAKQSMQCYFQQGVALTMISINSVHVVRGSKIIYDYCQHAREIKEMVCGVCIWCIHYYYIYIVYS